MSVEIISALRATALAHGCRVYSDEELTEKTAHYRTRITQLETKTKNVLALPRYQHGMDCEMEQADYGDWVSFDDLYEALK